jgi:hypothetical protein
MDDHCLSDSPAAQGREEDATYPTESLLRQGREPNIDSAVPADVDAFDRQRIRTLADKSSLRKIEDDVAITTVREAHSLSVVDSHSVEINGEVIIMRDA